MTTKAEATYDHLMRDAGGLITLTIDTKEPIELLDFVSAFTSIANEFERYIKQQRPDLNYDAKVYVREVRSGSIEADLIPLALAAIIDIMDKAIIVEEFVRRYSARLSAYFSPGGRTVDATKQELRDFVGGVVAIANDPNGSARLEAAVFEDGERKIRAAFQFSTPEAKVAVANMESHKAELDNVTRSDRENALMYFTRSDVADAQVGKPSHERVVIEDISSRHLPLIYASDLAEERIKDEIRNAEDNIYKKGFVVDVNVQTRRGHPIAYAVTRVHDVIDIGDDPSTPPSIEAPDTPRNERLATD